MQKEMLPQCILLLLLPRLTGSANLGIMQSDMIRESPFLQGIPEKPQILRCLPRKNLRGR